MKNGLGQKQHQNRHLRSAVVIKQTDLLPAEVDLVERCQSSSLMAAWQLFPCIEDED
jgi:hypothetical protein